MPSHLVGVHPARLGLLPTAGKPFLTTFAPHQLGVARFAVDEPTGHSHEHRLWDCNAAIFAGADFTPSAEALLVLSVTMHNHVGLIEKQTEHSITAQIEGLHCILN